MAISLSGLIRATSGSSVSVRTRDVGSGVDRGVKFGAFDEHGER